MKQLRKSKRLDRFTVKGKAAAVVQDAEAYQACWTPPRVDEDEGIRQGLEDAKKRRIQPPSEFFEQFEAEHGIHT